MQAAKTGKIHDVEGIRKDFPILSRQVNGKPLVYLDNAATSQKPRQVIDALVQYYETYNANTRRGLHTLAEEATSAFEGAREKVAKFIGAPDPSCIIFTRNTTESINIIAYSWGQSHISQGDVILLSQLEHHANLVPWQRLAKQTGAELRWIKLTSDGMLDMQSLKDGLAAGRVKLVAISHASNVLGTIIPVAEIAKLAHEHDALIAIDGAQSAPHFPVNVTEIDADFYSLSAHKMLGPTGVGALYGKLELLDSMEPFLTGGSMIGKVTFDSSTWAETPAKFEAGTPSIADAIAWGAAIDYLNELGMDWVNAHEREITAYALEKLSAINGVRLYGPMNAQQRVGVIAFTIDGIHPHDIAQILDEDGVAVRAGHHCCAPLMSILGVSATARASFYIYNRLDEVDTLVEAIRRAKKVFRIEH